MNEQIYAEAADWMVKNGGGQSDNAAFDAWLRASPLHMRAYFDLSATWEDTSQLRSICNTTADELIARARVDDNVVPLDVGRSIEQPRRAEAPLQRSQSEPAKLRPQRAVLVASIVIVCLGCGLFVWSSRGQTYSTALGEQRWVTLEDGSMVDLDTRTRIKVRFSSRERAIDLLEGRAFFRVAKNEKKPFVVRVNGTVVRDVGTEFDVYRRRSGLAVTVLEGRVSVSANLRESTEGKATEGSGPVNGVVLVPAGEQLTVTPSGIGPLAAANTAAAVAWTQHRLIFESDPLSEVVEDFNRYNAVQLIIDDPRLSSLQISGVFSSADPAPLIQFLRLQPEIAIREGHEQVHIARRQM